LKERWRSLGPATACISLIDIGQFYRLARKLLHILGQSGNLTGYARVSTHDHNMELQLKALTKAG